ncbi:Pyridoxal phosphate homeostasis protein [Gammaproteobacteria bacterium]|nr:Pyridoxal phosphate homeostasis protein [Gammaproteobacteria bacterium]
MARALSEAVAERLARVRERIAAAARRSGRDPADVRLVGISKRVPPEAILEAVRAGLDAIGENYVQEAVRKLAALEGHRELSRVRRHLVGPLQRNKARDAVAVFDVIETVDREALAVELDRRAASAGRTLDVLVQVNVSGEPQKSGVAPGEAAALVAACSKLASLRVTGLMTVPEASDDPERTRPAFAALRELRDGLREAVDGVDLRELSMGMSADFEIAIEEGATLVRVGTAIFGPREA